MKSREVCDLNAAVAGWCPISHWCCYYASTSPTGTELGIQQSPSLRVQGVRIDQEVTRCLLMFASRALGVKNKATWAASNVLDGMPARTLLDMLEDKSNQPK